MVTVLSCIFEEKNKKIKDGHDLNKSKHLILTKKKKIINMSMLVLNWFRLNPGLPNNLDF